MRSIRRPRPPVTRGPTLPPPSLWLGRHPDAHRGALVVWQVNGRHADGGEYSRLHVTNSATAEPFIAEALAMGVRVTSAQPSRATE